MIDENISEKFVARKVRSAQRTWSFIGLFIICLVISMPFYSANALATSLSITDNYGDDGIDSYLDAQSDTWTLKADISNIDDDEEISPEQVVLEVGSSQIEFSSCSGDALSTTCEFQSVLEDGITEGSYSFRVVLYDLIQDPNDENSTELGSELASDTDSVAADGSEPDISILDIWQDEGEMNLDFTVEDEPAGCVGIKTIEIIDSDNGDILETIDIDEAGECSFDYIDDSETAGVLSVSLDGEGLRHFKVRAADYLGHTQTSSAHSFDTDFVEPIIESGTLSLVDFGDYIGSYTQDTDVAINITECGNLDEVGATSEDMDFFSQAADCSLEDADSCLWVCQWDSITVTPSSDSVSAEIVALDEAGNIASKTTSASFSTDSAPPVVEFIGSEYVYDDVSYVAAGQQNTIYALISESGSGIDEEGIAANLEGLGGSEFQAPDECYEDETGTVDYVCEWTVSTPSQSGSSTKEVTVRFLEDQVGNNGDLISEEVVIDGSGPVMQDIEVYGFSAIGQKDYFQSNDDLIIEFTAQESSGLVVYVDLNDIVMDAENTYAYGEIDEDTGDYIADDLDGWVVFTQDECERNDEAAWECSLQIDSIKSGYDSDADFEVIVTDTAGNEAEWDDIESDVSNAEGDEGDYSIEIFGLDEETQPDFWETSTVNDNDLFIDLDTAELTYPRMIFDVGLRNDVNADAKLIEVGECSSEEDNAPTVSRALLYGGIEAGDTPKLSLILEFEPFSADDVVDVSLYDEFTEIEIPYTCNLDVYSVVDDNALTYPEEQQVEINVPFGFTEQGAIDENLDEIILERTSLVGFQILDKIKFLEDIISWVQVITTFINAILDIIVIVNAVQDLMGETSSKSPEPVSSTASGGCIALELPKGAATGVVGFLLKIPTVFSCNPSPSPGTWYGVWQKGVLEVYNAWKTGLLYNVGGLVDKDENGVVKTQKTVTTFSGEEKTLDRATANINTVSPVRAASLFDNWVISLIGLCIPGLIYNLEKLRQIHCVELSCLTNDVPAGVATVNDCSATFDYLRCKYFQGELIGMLIPFTGLSESIKNFVENVLTDPIGDIRAVLGLVCLVGCKSGAGFVSFCNGVRIFNKAFDMVTSVWAGVENLVASGGNVGIYDYCKASGIETNIDKLKESQGVTDSSVTTQDIAAEESASEDSGGDGQ